VSLHSDDIATEQRWKLAYDPITIRYKIVTLLYELVTNKLNMKSLIIVSRSKSKWLC